MAAFPGLAETPSPRSGSGDTPGARGSARGFSGMKAGSLAEAGDCDPFAEEDPGTGLQRGGPGGPDTHRDHDGDIEAAFAAAGPMGETHTEKQGSTVSRNPLRECYLCGRETRSPNGVHPKCPSLLQSMKDFVGSWRPSDKKIRVLKVLKNPVGEADLFYFTPNTGVVGSGPPPDSPRSKPQDLIPTSFKK